MHTYRQLEPGLFTVGFYSPDGRWEPESDHTDSEAAARRVNWLNGNQPADGAGAPSLGSQQEKLFDQLRAVRDEFGSTCTMFVTCDLAEYSHMDPAKKVRRSWVVSLHLEPGRGADGIAQGMGLTPDEALAELRRELKRRRERPTVYVEMTPEQAAQWQAAKDREAT